MAPRRVIADSDDENDNLSASQSPKIVVTEYAQVMQLAETPGTVRKSGSSTDPLEFKSIYDSNFAEVLSHSDDEPSSSIPLPTMEDVVNQPPKTRRTSPMTNGSQRRKTINSASLSSISETTSSKKAAKRTKSHSGISKSSLTEITTPGRSNERATTPDIFDFPSSGLSQPDSKKRITSRNAEKERKTYSRQTPKRSKSLHPSPSLHEACKMAPASVDDSSIDLKISYSGTTAASNLCHKFPQTSGSDANAISVNTVLCDLQSHHGESVQVPGSTLGETWQVMKSSSLEVNGSNIDDSLPQTSCDNIRHKNNTPSVLIPNTLTPSQKKQYELHVVNSGNHNGSSQQGTLDTIRYSVPSGVSVIMPPPHAPTQETLQQTAPWPSESQPGSTRDNQRKRTRSFTEFHEVRMIDSSSKSTSEKSSTSTRRKGTEYDQSPAASQSSVDELSLPSTEDYDQGRRSKVFRGNVGSSAPKNPSFRQETVSSIPEVREEGTHHATGLVNDIYQESTKATVENSSALIEKPGQADLDIPNSASGQSIGDDAVITSQHSASSQDDLSRSNEEYHVQPVVLQKTALERKRLESSDGDSRAAALKPSVRDSASKSMTGSTEAPKAVPKKRGRPRRTKTMPVISSKRIVIDDDEEEDEEIIRPTKRGSHTAAKHMPSTATSPKITMENDTKLPPPWSEPAEFTAKDATPVEDKDSDKIVGTGSNELAEKPLMKTPSKKLTKTAEQHSPLPGSKVAYRVGLSKRNRIAPLLKIRPRGPQ